MARGSRLEPQRDVLGDAPRRSSTSCRNGWGRIINISSAEGKEATKPSVSHYITNKHAINGFTKAVAFEYGPMGITCNAICPGAVETPLMKSAGPALRRVGRHHVREFLQTYADESMIKRLNTVEEVAAMAVLLASDLGGGITGLAAERRWRHDELVDRTAIPTTSGRTR